jgi:hypothetical protein
MGMAAASVNPIVVSNDPAFAFSLFSIDVGSNAIYLYEPRGDGVHLNRPAV